MQDVVVMQSSDEDGNTQEQIFTRICLDMLSDAAETNRYLPESVWTCCPMQPKRRTYRLPTTNAI